jgi:SnoaL-like domain
VSDPTPTGDHDQLRELLQRYARAADDRDLAALAAVFHPEAEVTGSRGTQTFEEWLDGMRAPRAFPISMHVIGDPLVVLGPDPDEAHLDTYAVVYQLSEPSSGGSDLTLGIRYLDDVVRLDGRWVVRNRTASTIWMR